ncbi:MAG: rhomboid family intramembrane serine protease [Pararhodobacter sp.]
MTPDDPTTTERHAPVVLWIVALCVIPEVVMTLLGAPLFGVTGLRRQAIVHGAFWPGLLSGWDPIYPGQQAVMFVSYAFLHGGLMHLLFNMLVLVHLARETVARLGQWGFALIFAVTAAGGAACFALLSSSPGPMVGASGAVFGLFGATQYWDYQRRRAAGAPLGPVWRMMFGLVLMNVVLWFLVSGYLAWEAHLGGYIAGFAFARIATPTMHHRAGGFR